MQAGPMAPPKQPDAARMESRRSTLAGVAKEGRKKRPGHAQGATGPVRGLSMKRNAPEFRASHPCLQISFYETNDFDLRVTLGASLLLFPHPGALFFSANGD